MSVFGFDDAVTIHGLHGTGLSNVFDATTDVPCTLEEVCDKLETILDKLVNRGFRREKISREMIMKKMNQVLVEVIDVQKEIKRIKKITGIKEGNHYARER